MKEGLHQLVASGVVFAPKVGVSILIFVAFWIAAIVLPRIIRHVGATAYVDQGVLRLLQRALKAGLLVFGALTALGTMGIDVSALVAGLGLTGFALGFALRDVLSNFVAGILILSYRPFRKTDQVSVAGVEGVVAEIDLRYTTLEHENQRVLIPNSTLFTNVITVTAGK